MPAAHNVRRHIPAPWTSILSYAFAGSCVVIATWLRVLLQPILGDHYAFVTYIPAILVVAALTEVRHASVALVGSLAAVDYFFLPPLHAFGLQSVADMLAVFIHTISGILLIALVQTQRTAVRVARESRERAEETTKSLQCEIETRQLAESARQESEERYARLLSLAPDAVLVNRQGKVAFVNAAALELFGATDAAQLLGRDTLGLFDEAFHDVIKERVTVLLSKGGPVPLIEERVRRLDGGLVDVEVSATAIPERGTVAILVLLRDITRRKQAEVLLRQSQARLQLQMDRMPLGCVVWDTEFRVERWNPAASRIFGYSEAEVIGKRAYDVIVPKEAQGGVEEVWRRLLQGDETAHSTNENLTKDGRRIWCEWFNTPLKQNGHVFGVLSMIQDVTEHRRLEMQSRQVQKMEALGQLTGGIAHDFNNLLTVINGYMDMTLSTMTPEDPLYRRLENVKVAGQRAAALTRQLLAFSRKQVLQPQVLDLNDVVRETETLLARAIGEQVELQTNLSLDLAHVFADPGQLEQVLMNLILNARDAMPNGGRLTIETANVQLDETYTSRVPNLKPGRYVLLAVSDTGCGMDSETQARIFEPFFTTKPAGKGTGLGLSTVFGIVKQSEGHIAVYSEVGCGTAFKVYLPSTDREVPGEELQEIPGSERGTETILMVEDEEAVRVFARTALEQYGYTVLEAASASEALLFSQRYGGQIHLLVTDVVLPQQGGDRLAERLRQHRPGISVVFMSGYTDSAVVRHEVLSAGVPFLQKPFTARDLARKVRQVLDARVDRPT